MDFNFVKVDTVIGEAVRGADDGASSDRATLIILELHRHRREPTPEFVQVLVEVVSVEHRDYFIIRMTD